MRDKSPEFLCTVCFPSSNARLPGKERLPPGKVHKKEKKGEKKRRTTLRPAEISADFVTCTENFCPRGLRCDEKCPAFELCDKRILIVGGVERMEALYRDFIEGRGGELDYHSGHLRNGINDLKSSLRRADIILCPVNCNSHGACLKVKQLAKKHNKTFYMLPNASLSALSRLLGGM